MRTSFNIALYKYLKQLIDKTVSKYPDLTLLSLFENSTDLIWSFAITTEKTEHPTIYYHAVLPFDRVENNFVQPDIKDHVIALLKKADSKNVISSKKGPQSYRLSEMFAVDASDVLLVIGDPEDKAVADIVYYARMSRKLVKAIDPTVILPTKKPNQLIYD